MNSFDYVIIGGGTAGLALAARLAEDASISVCVLEAGKDHSQNKDVKTPGMHMANYGKESATELNFTDPFGQRKRIGRIQHRDIPARWPNQYLTQLIPQLNFMQLVRSPASEYDALETNLGAEGWNGAEFLKYFKKSQSLPAKQPVGDAMYPLTPDSALYGSGPIPNTVPVHTPGLAKHYYAACAAADVPFNPTGGCGDNGGVWPALAAVDPESGTRVSSESAYLAPMRGAANLTILTEARATRMIFDEAVCTGVQYQDTTGEHVVGAKKEVILCAGAFHTPRLLEESGIGGKAYIPDGVKQVVDLPGVGSNLQDHPSVIVLCETGPKIDSHDDLADPAIAAQKMEEYKTHGTGPLSTAPFFFSYLSLNKFMSPKQITELKALAAQATPQNTGIESSCAVELLKKWMADDESYQLEIIMVPIHVPVFPDVPFVPGKRYCFFSVVLLHPFSSGSAHRAPEAGLTADFGLLEHEIDRRILVAGVQYVQRIIAQPALAETAGLHALAPGPDVVGDAAVAEWIKQAVFTSYHPVGTAAMLPREEGGVVDATLRVHGTANVRVVDASIIPVQMSCHPMATIYAIAEKRRRKPKARHVTPCDRVLSFPPPAIIFPLRPQFKGPASQQSSEHERRKVESITEDDFGFLASQPSTGIALISAGEANLTLSAPKKKRRKIEKFLLLLTPEQLQAKLANETRPISPVKIVFF
ncbi:hypothetical protein C8R43DRAFT_952828 [Mycena crocata]|nr:hypothetical protein C8R43DRAFT_952828 [Mycena crocata]